MIQRIQSVYLLLTTILAVLFLSGNILEFQNGTFINLTGIGQVSSEAGSDVIGNSLPLTILLILIPLFSLVAIFLFRNRRRQMNVILVLIVLIILEFLAVFYYSNKVIQAAGTELIPGLKMVLPVITLILSFLAFRSIRKDENLVRSYDRLR